LCASDTNAAAWEACEAFVTAGVPSNDISIVSNNADNRHGEHSNAGEGAGAGAGIGAVVGGAGGLLTGLGLIANRGVGTVVAAVGACG